MSLIHNQIAQLAALENDDSEAASEKKIALAGSISEGLSILADEAERRGQDNSDLRKSAADLTDFAHQTAQDLHERRKTQALTEWLTSGKPYTPSV